LKAGLYAPVVDPTLEEIQEERESKRFRRNESNIRQPIVRDPKVPLFPLPINYGSWYMNEERDFYIPFDIFYQHENHLIKYDRKPNAYVKIRSSMFMFSALAHWKISQLIGKRGFLLQYSLATVLS
jgi:hypothetical protein